MRVSVRSNDKRVREILNLKVGDYKTTVPQSRSLHRYLPDGSWKRQRCFIVGGGPSLKGFDFKRLEGERVIAINRAYLDCPFADIMYFMDKNRFYRWTMDGKFGEKAKQAFINFNGLRVFIYMNHEVPDVLYVPRAGRRGVPFSLQDGINTGTNSGYGALQIAICLQANPIYLLGFDMKHEINYDGKEVQNYHSGYPHYQPESVVHSFIKGFAELKSELQVSHRSLRIINLNPDSALRCFEFGHIKEVLW